MYTFSLYLCGLTKRHIWNILTDHMTPLGDCLAQSVDYSFCHLGYACCQQYVQLIKKQSYYIYIYGILMKTHHSHVSETDHLPENLLLPQCKYEVTHYSIIVTVKFWKEPIPISRDSG